VITIAGVAGEIVIGRGWDVDALKLLSPEYAAVRECVPTTEPAEAHHDAEPRLVSGIGADTLV
jgi:hypothetical protein